MLGGRTCLFNNCSFGYFLLTKNLTAITPVGRLSVTFSPMPTPTTLSSGAADAGAANDRTLPTRCNLNSLLAHSFLAFLKSESLESNKVTLEIGFFIGLTCLMTFRCGPKNKVAQPGQRVPRCVNFGRRNPLCQAFSTHGVLFFYIRSHF